jgi:hypothetical protein
MSFEEEDISQLWDLSAANLPLTAWCLKDEVNNSEGLNKGWYYFILGGGERPNPPTINRVSVGIDNTDPDVIEGDFAVSNRTSMKMDIVATIFVFIQLNQSRLLSFKLSNLIVTLLERGLKTQLFR